MPQVALAGVFSQLLCIGVAWIDPSDAEPEHFLD
jgi:hypothetical protein